jgi:hypothetical protein
MPSTDLKPPPYHEILADLVASTMRAQAELVRTGGQASHQQINRHFVWLAVAYPEGTNRHFFEAISGNFPLRKRGLRYRSKLPQNIANLLSKRLPLPLEGDANDLSLARAVQKLGLVQEEPTRISSLIKLAFQETLALADLLPGDAKPDGRGAKAIQSKKSEGISIRSPLSIVYDFLTAPDLPGTRAYALLALRNLLFETFDIFPDALADIEARYTFSWRAVETAISYVWTSLRPRFWSQGEDKLPAEGRNPIDGLVRHFLAVKGVLWLHFRNSKSCLKYLDNEIPRSTEYEFTRSALLERLPELGEIVNELWGLPVPMRGADTVFRGGLKFSRRRGLVLAIHGGPGTGKTTFALALGAFLAPFDIQTLFLTGDELEDDLKVRAEGLVPDELRRMTFFPDNLDAWLTISHFKFDQETPAIDFLERTFSDFEAVLGAFEEPTDTHRSPKVCKAVIVLDGLHDIFALGAGHSSNVTSENADKYAQLHGFIDKCRNLQALVILTTGEDWSSKEWANDATLDYLVDVSMRLSHESIGEYGQKPDRRLTLRKARHQLCAPGTHGIQIAGTKGVRLSPQVNYQLDRRSIWMTRLPDTGAVKTVLRKTTHATEVEKIPAPSEKKRWPTSCEFDETNLSVFLPRRSNIFLNGKGSGGKAALALKIALAPVFSESNRELLNGEEKVLVVSFLYPQEYYGFIVRRLLRLRRLEYPESNLGLTARVDVEHLYPGYLKPNDLFNRIEWRLDNAELHGQPYTTVVIDGIHNIYLQFPEIEKHVIFWPQLYSALRTRPVSIVTTHTTFALPSDSIDFQYQVDDKRSEPLRHALVQKTDFRLEINPYREYDSGVDTDILRHPELVEPNTFSVRVISAINQSIPKPEDVLLWSREKLVLYRLAALANKQAKGS